ncbi:MAG TPA: polysaccharide pyruvyl transferase family protein [Methanocella sp.]|uniref:polysaccharide pyruvyl transferase family protein n=1 Tax=Methanocella sp. TaxID=2052833 RepID=UPI002B9F1E95|nr:polysaccharide pyruvyl transferase family protein [Methanocella sp.]HTY90803.1 polysaccharide pyruvyl transferase family protein [Methanocella sp.]
MSGKAGLLYDNLSNNTGDAAIGLSMIKILNEAGVRFEVLFPGCFKAADYETIVIGGGHIIRPRPDYFYDNFRVPGPHILNAAGIVGRPRDLGYLEDYRYVTVRSKCDREKLYRLRNTAHVVPCTTLLLEDMEDFPIRIKSPALGVHLLPGMMGAREEKAFTGWASSLPYTVYFIPITHYNQDYRYMQRLSAGIPNSVILPLLSPLEIFTLMGRIDRLITSSLHGAIFAYAHNTPFIVLGYDEKMSAFMEDRGLQEYVFRGFNGMKDTFERLCDDLPDYSTRVARDRQTLFRHVERLKELLPEGETAMQPDMIMKDLQSYSAGIFQRPPTPAMRLNSLYQSFDRKLHYEVSRVKGDIMRRVSVAKKAPIITAKKL